MIEIILSSEVEWINSIIAIIMVYSNVKKKYVCLTNLSS